jgi:hypothetical protein
MTDDRIELDDFIRELGITASPTRAENNPSMVADDEWNRTASHWRVQIRRGRTRIVVPFSQGSAHVDPPTAADVLNCLISDATGYENAQSFEDWCGEYGYDTDSRKAERTYKAVERATAKLRRLLGDDFDRIWQVEGL